VIFLQCFRSDDRIQVPRGACRRSAYRPRAKTAQAPASTLQGPKTCLRSAISTTVVANVCSTSRYAYQRLSKIITPAWGEEPVLLQMLAEFGGCDTPLDVVFGEACGIPVGTMGCHLSPRTIQPLHTTTMPGHQSRAVIAAQQRGQFGPVHNAEHLGGSS